MRVTFKSVEGGLGLIGIQRGIRNRAACTSKVRSVTWRFSSFSNCFQPIGVYTYLQFTRGISSSLISAMLKVDFGMWRAQPTNVAIYTTTCLNIVGSSLDPKQPQALVFNLTLNPKASGRRVSGFWFYQIEESRIRSVGLGG